MRKPRGGHRTAKRTDKKSIDSGRFGSEDALARLIDTKLQPPRLRKERVLRGGLDPMSPGVADDGIERRPMRLPAEDRSSPGGVGDENRRVSCSSSRELDRWSRTRSGR